MRTILFTLIIAAFAAVQSGCATTFRAGGPKAGVDAGAAIGPPAAPVIIQEPPPAPPIIK